MTFNSNDSLCFDCFRKLEDGDIVNVDVTVCYKGCHGMLSPDEHSLSFCEIGYL